MIPLRSALLIPAPEAAVRRALWRADLWTRSARALGGRGTSGRGASDATDRALHPGDTIRFRRVAGRTSVVCTVSADEAGLPVLTGPRFRVSVLVGATGAGTMTTIETLIEPPLPGARFALRPRVLTFAQMVLGVVTVIATDPIVVMAGAVIRDGQVLAARRRHPPGSAGMWELPGGKVEDGETEQQALARELAEELGIEVVVGERVGLDVPLADGLVLRTRLAELSGQLSGEPAPGPDHDEVRWIGSDEWETLPWLPADRSVLVPVATLLQPQLQPQSQSQLRPGLRPERGSAVRSEP